MKRKVTYQRLMKREFKQIKLGNCPALKPYLTINQNGHIITDTKPSIRIVKGTNGNKSLLFVARESVKKWMDGHSIKYREEYIPGRTNKALLGEISLDNTFLFCKDNTRANYSKKCYRKRKGKTNAEGMPYVKPIQLQSVNGYMLEVKNKLLNISNQVLNLIQDISNKT